MLTKEYYFELPPELIAQEPVERRGDEKLLLLNKNTGLFEDKVMKDFPSLLDENSILVVNNSKVRKARCFGKTEFGGLVEFLFLEENEDHSWICMISKSKKQKIGRKYSFYDKNGELVKVATLIGEYPDGNRQVTFEEPLEEEFFSRCGHVPLPPYIKREDKFSDETRYQTIYAKNEGSVAAPTAGLHFTPEILEEIKNRGIEIVEVTLHVGAGTFLPVRSENIEDHHMHYERYTILPEVADKLNEAKKSGKKIVSVGTTSVRTLESAVNENGLIESGTRRTNIFIHPGVPFRFVDNLLTNFHTPESTLLMLVSALAGKENIFRAYEHAVQERYRFFSYGDAMFING
ncbi:MAG: tRNA preQ1(34) S-adenosylmethionine ribosyltransferase-isomerase QueA [Sphaerochaetaceae bacterium]|nr:tRNA preQ1(34) S-adenosylmethionine ribosyltransferase-isomerase QueA [Sphaerochaetaceae bacterium]